jgi:hypothetical protein
VQEFGTQIFPEGWHRSEFEQQAALEEAYENGQKVNIDKLGSLREGLLEAVRKQIQAKGYDGIQYENTIEGGGTSYIVFNPKQIYPARTEANCDAIQSPLQRSTSECS